MARRDRGHGLEAARLASQAASDVPACAPAGMWLPPGLVWVLRGGPAPRTRAEASFTDAPGSAVTFTVKRSPALPDPGSEPQSAFSLRWVTSASSQAPGRGGTGPSGDRTARSSDCVSPRGVASGATADIRCEFDFEIPFRELPGNY